MPGAISGSATCTGSEVVFGAVAHRQGRGGHHGHGADRALRRARASCSPAWPAGWRPDVRVGDVVVGTELPAARPGRVADLSAATRCRCTGARALSRPTRADRRCAGRGARALRDPARAGRRSRVDAFGLGAPRVHRGLLVSGDRFVSTADESAALRTRCPTRWRSRWKAPPWRRCATTTACPSPRCARSPTAPTTRRTCDFAAYLAQVAGAQARALIAALLPLLPP